MRHPNLIAASLVCLAALPGADVYRLAPIFTGKSIPDPPEQGKPWTSPETKLPGFFKTAAGLLFDEGGADPRGCEYRDVEVGAERIIKTHGWVFPGRPGEPHRFVVGWNGVLYPAITVGAKADLDADVRAMAAMRPLRDGESVWMGNSWGILLQEPSRMKLVMLLRLGRVDLAEALFAAWTRGNRDGKTTDLTEYGTKFPVSYLTLARGWAYSMHGRLVSAHLRGDDAIALDAARRLSVFATLATSKANELGFKRYGPEYGHELHGTYFVLRQLDELLADHERRAAMPPRTPIPKYGTDPKTRVAALIRDLDQIQVFQDTIPGSVNPGSHAYVKELVREGEPAIEPLLNALETDTRLTRTARMPPGGEGPYEYIYHVDEAELTALNGLIPTTSSKYTDLRARMPASRKELARALRHDWEQVRGLAEAEQWFRILADDTAEPARWLEAAAWMTQGIGKPPWKSLSRKPGEVVVQKGDVLRSRRDPSVTELMVKRVKTMLASWGVGRGVPGACAMGAILMKWDEPAAPLLLRELMHACREQFAAEPKQEYRPVPVATFAEFTVFLARRHDLAALDQYAALIATATPQRFEYRTGQEFEPMWLYREHPAIEAAARTLFADPKSPWIAAFRQALPTGDHAHGDHVRLLTSPLIRVPAFREGLAGLLADKTEVGTITRLPQPDSYSYTLRTPPSSVGNSYGRGTLPDPDAPGLGVASPIRVCDVVGLQLASLDGTPAFAPYWSLAKRDASVTACARFLAKYSDRFEDIHRPGSYPSLSKVAHLKFPSLGRPATAEEARSGVVIFSMEGQGEVRLVRMPPFPLQAKWVANKDFPIDYWRQTDNTVTRGYDRDGYVWQAEEVRSGDHWDRFYGFVGNSIVTRVPAAEIEFGPEHFAGVHLPDGLDVQLWEAPSSGRLKPGGPAVFSLTLTNRRGLPRSVPTEFVRDGKALRRGLTLGVMYQPKTGTQATNPDSTKWRALDPRVTEVFDPGDNARTLEATEVFEAFRLDLAQWFDFSKPGFYLMTATFDEKSGVGPGKIGHMIRSDSEE